ncbi:MAG: hypothetical protein ACQGVC_24170 [Myxococcota bacterium]
MALDLPRRWVVGVPAATLLLFGLVVVTSGIAAALARPPAADEPGRVLLRVFAVCAVDATLLTWAILRTAARGARLVGLVVALYFGIAAFMTQNETLYFNRALDVPAGVVWGVLASGLVTAVLFGLAASRWLVPRETAARATGVTSQGLAWKTALLAGVFYPALYFGFGYFVLWQDESARLLYQGSAELAPFAEHMAGVLRDDPWLTPWQCLRGLLWVGLAAGVMRDATSRWPETALLVGLLFALLMNMQHWIPNPFLPPEVRWAHFVETVPSNFLLGAGIVWTLRDRTLR